jgi:hypothetical protein
MSAPSIEAAYEIGAKGSPPVEAERLAFEAWMKGHCWLIEAEWDGTGYVTTGEHGDYVSPSAMRTRGMWAAWRDRAALSSSAAQHEGMKPIKYHDHPDFIGGIGWTQCEIDWINSRVAAAVLAEREKLLINAGWIV